MRPSSMKSTRSARASGRAGRCSETSTAHGRLLEQVEERLGGLRVELRRRLVEQQQPRPEGERRGETHALQLAGGELGHGALGEVLGSDRGERFLDAAPDLGRRQAGVLEPEGDLVRDPAHHRLVLGILEDGGDEPDQRGRRRLAGIEAPDRHAPGEDTAVEVRHEAGERAQERRLAAAGRAEEGDVLAVVDRERDTGQHLATRCVRETDVRDDG